MAYMTELDFQRGVRTIANIPPEQRAVRSMEPLVSGLAQSDAQRYVDTTQRNTERERMNAILSNERADVRAAKKDARFALPITLGKVGLDAIGAYEIRKETDVEMKRKQKDSDYWAAFGEMTRINFQKIIDMLTASKPSYPSSGMNPIAPASMIGGG